MNVARLTIIGNLTRDPESRSLPSGQTVVNFSVAVNERFGQREDTYFFRVEAWGKTGEIAERFLRKGSMVFVEGRFKADEFTTRDGEKRQSYGVVANQIVLGPKRDSDGGGGGGGRSWDDRGASRAHEPGYEYESGSGGGGGHNEPPRRQAPPPREEYSRETYNDPPAQPAGGESNTEDDLPF